MGKAYNSSGPKLRLVDELKIPHIDLISTQKTLEAVEHDHIVRVLEQTNWKVGGQNGAAEILLYEPPQIENHTVSHSEGMETVKAARGKSAF
jgi:transcriptional regulator with GAF, ATPase, and Fis domain